MKSFSLYILSVLSFVMLSFTLPISAHAEKKVVVIGGGKASPKFKSKEAREYIEARYIDTCSKQYMAQFDTTSLSQEKLTGFRTHAEVSCECLLGKMRMEDFNTDEIADVAKSCCTTVAELVTEDKDREYYERLQKKYLNFVYNRGYLKKCGFVTDGLDLNTPEYDSDKRVK